MTTPSDLPTDRHRQHDEGPLADVADPGSADVTREFWGGDADWSSEARRPTERSGEHRGLAATVSRWWNSTGPIPATRAHGTPTTEIPVQRGTANLEDDTDELDLDDWLVDAWSADSSASFASTGSATVSTTASNGSEIRQRSRHLPDLDDVEHDLDDVEPVDDDPWDLPPAVAPRPAIDPLLARLGGLAVVVTLFVPVVLGFVSDSEDGDALRTAPAPSTAESAPTPTDAAVAGTGGADVESGSEPASVATDSEEPSAATPSAAGTVAATTATTAAADDSEPIAEQLAVDECSIDYEVVVGDFWIRIADASGVALADLLGANSATVSTPLYPGSTICLPAGATTPAPPTASSSSGGGQSSSPTTAAPTTPPSTAAPTTAAPTTTSPPPPPPPNATAAEVQAIIRAVWPDDLEDRALEIAWRESNYIPTAKNYCCYGVFQIYWSVHRSWLSGMGITSAEQLYDPTTNARAALALYERAGGWGPWGG